MCDRGGEHDRPSLAALAQDRCGDLGLLQLLVEDRFDVADRQLARDLALAGEDS